MEHSSGRVSALIGSCFLLLLATASGGAAADKLAGKVIDRDSRVPIGRALIQIVTAHDGTLLAQTRTAPDGTYVVSLHGSMPALVIAAAESLPYATYHGLLDQTAQRRLISLSRITWQEAAWLRRVNADRHELHLRPVIMDEIALQVARAHAADMAAHGYLEHADRRGVQHWERYAALSGVGGDYENIARGENATWGDIERAFIAEGAPKRAGLCTHYTTLFDPHARWIGLGTARARDEIYFDQELIEYPY
ncbi:MAG: hypothetical protein JO135_10445 [Candidatus Eremiobacteraeota bacterium]|nr:hypothetical protein [Candidatus Eremiobacteraeota bacterium]